MFRIKTDVESRGETYSSSFDAVAIAIATAARNLLFFPFTHKCDGYWQILFEKNSIIELMLIKLNGKIMLSINVECELIMVYQLSVMTMQSFSYWIEISALVIQLVYTFSTFMIHNEHPWIQSNLVPFFKEFILKLNSTQHFILKKYSHDWENTQTALQILKIILNWYTVSFRN